ncbi:MAG: hypothetical protein Q9M30_10585, partial [Mariprofundaceae bacterium]|nr:hypothetical protein [Mariprofundaceae bacterium]
MISKGVVEIDPELPEIELRDSLLQDYIDVIGRLSKTNVANDLWWATDMASKNRFVSPFPVLLGDFVQSMLAIEQCESTHPCLHVTGASWPLIAGIQAYAESKGIEVRVLTFPGARLCYRLKGKVRVWGGLFKSALLAVLNIFKAHRAFPPDSQSIGRNNPVYLVKSFVYPASFGENGCYHDPFFGDLPTILQRQLGDAVQLVTMSLGFTDKYHCYQSMKQLTDRVVVPLEAYLRLRDVVRALVNISRHLLFHPFRLPDAIPFQDADLVPLLQESLAADGGSIQFFQYLHYYAARRFARQYDVSACLLTYEGNPWERMYIRGLREVCPGVLVIGYQHSVVPQAAAGMFLSESELGLVPHPDRIVTTGEKTADILKKYSAFPHERIYAGCALRYAYLYDLAVLPRRCDADDRFVVLVALEGVMEVADLLS